MKRLDINFAPRARRQAWLDWCILGLGIAAAVSVLLVHLYLDTTVGDLAYKVERLQHAVARAELDAHETPAPANAPAAETAWLEMLDGLGLQLGESVTLLSFQGDSQAEHLELQCEAKDTDAMFAFVARLKEGRLLSEVALRGHETVRDHPYKPVRFSLTARRRAQP